MEAVVQKWGCDFGVRIPIATARKMSLKTGYKVYIVPLKQKTAQSTPRKGWAKAFAKAGKKEQMLIPEKIGSSSFEWEW